MVRIDVVRYFFIGQLVLGSCLTVQAMEVARKNVLYRAVKENDLYTVKKLITDGVNIEMEGSDGSTLLFVAVRASFTDIIRFLLARGASPNAQTSKKYAFFSPFMYALFKGSGAIVTLFFEETVKIKPAQRYMCNKPAKFSRMMNKRHMLKCYEKDEIPEYDYVLRLAICSELDAFEKVKLLVANGFGFNIYFSMYGDGFCNPIEYAEGLGYQVIAAYFLSIFEKDSLNKQEKKKKRLADLKKLCAPSPKLFDKYKRAGSQQLPGLKIDTIGTLKPDIKIFFAIREKRQTVESEGYCLVQ